jgi:ribosomal protein S12 methylthiotransferase accessory factor
MSVPVTGPPPRPRRRWALRQRRRPAGRAAADADLLVVSVEDYLHGDLEALNRQMRRDGRDWALFKSGGSMPLLGPVFRAGAAPCWACLSRPMVENRPGDTVLAGGTVAARPARGSSPVTRSLAVNFAAFELARAAAGKGLASLDRSIIAFDLQDRACREHFVRLEVNCPVCGPARDDQATSRRASRPPVLDIEAGAAPGRRRLALGADGRGDAGPER